MWKWKLLDQDTLTEQEYEEQRAELVGSLRELKNKKANITHTCTSQILYNFCNHKYPACLICLFV